MILVADQL